MSEEKDSAQAQREMAETGGELSGLPPLKQQLRPSPGLPERQAAHRRRERVLNMLHTLPSAAQRAIQLSYAGEGAPPGATTGVVGPAGPPLRGPGAPGGGPIRFGNV
jgi:phospholipid/cholesterol/gamma-HCH transport system ATP-binding protein